MISAINSNITNPRNRSLPANFPASGSSNQIGTGFTKLGGAALPQNYSTGENDFKMPAVSNRQALGLVPLFKKQGIDGGNSIMGRHGY
jgi:hypothetical protein